MHSSTLALQDDEAVSPSLGSGVAPPLANEDRLDIVRIGPPAQEDTRQRRDQPAVRWGQGIPIRPVTTTQSPTGLVPSRAATVPTAQSSATHADTTLSHAAPADTTSRPILPLGIETPTSTAISSVSDAITRLQRERDLALRRNEELHAYYKRERKSLEESHARRDSSLSRDYLKASGDLEITQRQLDQVQSLCETQTLMIKRLQEELGEEAEFDPDQDPHVRRVHREYEQRVEDYEDRIKQLESELQEGDDKQAKEIERLRRERNMARDEAAEAQREKKTLFNEQKRCELQVQRLSSEVQRANQAMDKRSKLADRGSQHEKQAC
jgi:hypothetical protein